MKRVSKRLWILWLLLCLTALILHSTKNAVLQYPILAVGKYLSLAYAFALGSVIFLTILKVPRFHGWLKQLSMFLSVLVFMSFTILTIDTFLFHTLKFYPGMFRYAIYASFPILYLVFILPGSLFYLGKEE